MSSDGEFLFGVFAAGLAIGVLALVYSIVVFRRLKAAEERATRIEKEKAAIASVAEPRPVFFKRYEVDALERVHSRASSEHR